MQEVFISIDEINFRILTQNLESKNTPIVLLHGFAGSANIWKFLFENLNLDFPLIAIDLIGHGKTSSPNNYEVYTESAQLDQLNKIFIHFNIQEAIFLGYSMGGRLALSYTINYQNKIKGLILESSSPGIEEENIRSKRVKNDLLIAEQIQNNELKVFFSEWYKQPVFSSLRNIPNKLESLIERKTGNNKIGLINSLKGFSTGNMKSYWKDISKMEIPVLLVCGSLDTKYYEIMQKMNSLISNSTLKVNFGAGHITHLEKPDEFLNFVRTFLRTFLE